MSYFGTLQHKMPPIADNKEVPTMAFLLAAGAILPFLDTFGTAFKPVKADIGGNINRLKEIYKKNPEKYATLRGMLEDEKANGNVKDKNSAANCILWLRRAMMFLSSIIKYIAEDPKKDENITKIVQRSYEETLKKYHGWLVQNLFSLVARATPFRRDVLKALGASETVPEEEVLKDILEYSKGAHANAAVILELLIELDLNSENSV